MLKQQHYFTSAITQVTDVSVLTHAATQLESKLSIYDGANGLTYSPAPSACIQKAYSKGNAVGLQNRDVSFSQKTQHLNMRSK